MKSKLNMKYGRKSKNWCQLTIYESLMASILNTQKLEIMASTTTQKSSRRPNNWRGGIVPLMSAIVGTSLNITVTWSKCSSGTSRRWLSILTILAGSKFRKMASTRWASAWRNWVCSTTRLQKRKIRNVAKFDVVIFMPKQAIGEVITLRALCDTATSGRLSYRWTTFPLAEDKSPTNARWW